MSSSNLKVTFVDNAKHQYDANATLIEIGRLIDSKSPGKLFLGDRFSSAFLQLRSRKCSVAVNCDKNIHSLSREEDIKYLNVDAADEIGDQFEKAYDFIDSHLRQSQNVTVFCESGTTKSAAILSYFVMKKRLCSTVEAVDYLKKFKQKIYINKDVMALINKVAKKNGLSPFGNKKRNKGLSDWTSIIVVVGVVVGFFSILYGCLYLLVGKL